MGANRSQVPLGGVTGPPSAPAPAPSPTPAVKSNNAADSRYKIITTASGRNIRIPHIPRDSDRPAGFSFSPPKGAPQGAANTNKRPNSPSVRPLAGSRTRSLATAPIDPTDPTAPSPNGDGFDNSDAMSDGMSDRDRDQRPDGKSGKKRKVPSSLQTLGRDEAARDLDGQLRQDEALAGEDIFEPNPTAEDREDGPSSSRTRPNSDAALYIDNGDTGDRDDAETVVAGTGTTAFPRKGGKWTLREPKRSPQAQACAWRKSLFLKRKAALITLFLDAQTAINQALNKPPGTGQKAGSTSKDVKGKDKPSLILPEVAVFEQMMPALEDVGVGQWPLDQPGWRTGVEVRDETKVHLERWRASHDQRRRDNETRKKVVRGGWIPEGSFEFEVNSKGE